MKDPRGNEFAVGDKVVHVKLGRSSVAFYDAVVTRIADTGSNVVWIRVWYPATQWRDGKYADEKTTSTRVLVMK